MQEKTVPGQWSRQRAWAWHRSRPWVRGFNYLPSNCTLQFEMWQPYGFEERLSVMENEMALAEATGFNSVRIAMNFETWRADRDGYMERLEQVLALLDRYGMTAMPRFGNDCTVPREEYCAPVFGPVETAWGYHGGVVRSPHRAGMDVGWLPIDDPQLEPLYYEWVTDIIRAHKDDPRVVIWNLWNEPGNTKRFDRSAVYLKNFFAAARTIDPMQPLTADSWTMTFHKDVTDPLSEIRDIERLAMDLSDVVSFHHYGGFEHVAATIAALKDRYDRPLYNTEWLHRIFDNNVEQLFPLFFLEEVGSYHYGLVEGRAQYYEPWESLRGSALPIDRWQHDIYRANHRPYSHKEIEIFKQFSALAEKRFAEKSRPE